MTGDGGSYRDRLVDEPALEAYLTERLGPVETWRWSRLGEGHSNETLALDWGARELVLRRPPAGETADRAHDVLREYRVIDAIQGTDVPLPGTVLACEDASVIGADFYLMERLEGDVVRTAEPDRFATPSARARIGDQLVDALAAVHGVDYEAVGLEEFGHPPGFTERQVRRWSEQLTWAFQRTAEVREVEALYDVMEWLQANVPEDPPAALVHGDFKLDNVLFAPGTPPELVGVFDWEMSTLGDPRTDLGWLLSFWRDPGDPDPPLPSLLPTFTAREGYPSRGDVVDRWESATGFAYADDRFYRALAVYKLCGLGEMFFARSLAGDADDPLYPKMEAGVPALAERALRIIDGGEPL
ncbi:MAG: phosphotransferase family protein [Halobacteriales archaeon]|nr:phosphotransferase family protein [Halobacteriales archaeon]